MIQLLLILDQLDKNNIVHWDIKPDNILIHSEYEDQLDVRLGDFGSSMQCNKN